MAKAKKAETSETKAPTGAKPTAGAKPAAKAKKPAKAKQPATAAGSPMIDTSNAALSAAKMIGAKWMPAGSSTGAAPKESASFRQMKEGLNKPASTTMANLLDKAGGPEQKKQNQPFSGGKQVGRNQTFGADVNRAGVPRRTGGG